MNLSDTSDTVLDVSTVEPDFAARLRARMGELDMTVASLEQACDYAFSIRTIWRWRGGHAAPGIEALPILATALRTSCDWLLGHDPTTEA